MCSLSTRTKPDGGLITSFLSPFVPHNLPKRVESLPQEETERGRCVQHQVPVPVDHRSFPARVIAPQHEDQVFALPVQQVHDGVGEDFPALALVRTGLAESPDFDVNAFLGKLMDAFH